ncbi:hypothetical protein SAY86_025659 [Trapa natans]|uniref:Uncharacterized protein n=1 Tax=Trapa natans TaxID=22666 RepID=A0AAN7QDS5_TRANT|nr:hypothetical protein SAY86_025659 [Trapa natans]
MRLVYSRANAILPWGFLIITIIYILHSSNLLLRKDTSVTELSSTNTAIATSTTSSSSSLSSSEKISTQVDVGTATSKAALCNLTSVLEEIGEDQQAEADAASSIVCDDPRSYQTELKHIVFGIAASANLWQKRKEYIKLWWRPKQMRGVVWLERMVRTYKNEPLPEIRISGSTSRFKYSNRQGHRSALRISRVVSETLRLGLKHVKWFVMGDDDTVFIVDNVVRVLSKYDHRQFYYIGSSSESHVQNIYFSYAMAYGGGGFAISYPLAVELAKMQDRCIQRYPGLYGSDDRMQACMAELGVPLTRESGFHQYDVYGDLLGLLAAHPVTPLVSVHHLDVVEPVFPAMNRVKALRHLFNSVSLDSASIMQQSVCYSAKHYWSISVSWGYVVQIVRGVISPRELETPTRTFLNWYKRADYTAYAFNTRPVMKHPCQKPFVFYMISSRYDRSRRQTVGLYRRRKGASHPRCRWKMESPASIETVVVLKRPDPLRWQKSERRDCCRVLPSRKSWVMYIWVGNCRAGEVAEL